MRFYHWSFWVYLAPFLALSLSAIVPFITEEFVNAQTAQNNGALNDDYLDWIQETRSAAGSQENDYEEISIEDQIQMLDSIPVQGEGWKVDLQTIVTPLSLEEFWDCFWSNDAPYGLLGIMISSEDLLILATDWRNPSPGQEVHLDTDVS